MVLSEEGKVGGVLLSKGSQSPGRRRGRVKEEKKEEEMIYVEGDRVTSS